MPTSRKEIMMSEEDSDQELACTTFFTGRPKAAHTAPIARRSRRLIGVSHLSKGPVKFIHSKIIFGFSWN